MGGSEELEREGRLGRHPGLVLRPYSESSFTDVACGPSTEGPPTSSRIRPTSDPSLARESHALWTWIVQIKEAVTTRQPVQAYLIRAYLYIIHGLWAVLVLCTITVGPHLCIHHLSVSHHQDTHWFPWTHL